MSTISVDVSPVVLIILVMKNTTETKKRFTASIASLTHKKFSDGTQLAALTVMGYTQYDAAKRAMEWATEHGVKDPFIYAIREGF